jgi:hypothetical protein
MTKLVVFLMSAAMALAADVTGKWDFDVSLDAGSGSPRFTFAQSGESVTGTYSGAAGESKLTGTVKGDRIEFTFDANLGGENLKVVYKGKIEGEGAMSGTADYGGMASGKWTAKRAK